MRHALIRCARRWRGSTRPQSQSRSRKPRRRPQPTSGRGERKRSALSVQRVRFLIHYSMFVRWQTYHSQALYPWHAERNDKRARRKAILVESVRVNGKPRQRHIAFLGSIASDESIDGVLGKRFWRDVLSTLKRLGNRVGPEDYERIIASIAAKVGGVPPTEAELEQFGRKVDRDLESLGASLAPYRQAPRPHRRRRPLRDRVKEAASKYAELLSKLDQETIDAAFRLKPAPPSR
jgi:hypothetical protein